MSAWICSKRHIDALVTPLYETTPELATRTGQMLWQQNIRSVNKIYGGPMPSLQYQFEPCTTKMTEDGDRILVEPLTTVDVLKLLDSYEYQSCEVEFQGAVVRFCNSLRKHLVSNLNGYKNATWSI